MRRLAILSDTHGHVPRTTAALRLLEPFAPDLYVHCGDLDTPEIVGLFTGLPAHFVRGNCDDDLEATEAAVRRAGGTWHGALGELEPGGRSLAFCHGDDLEVLERAILAPGREVVCHGHTHLAGARVTPQGVLVINPGAMVRARVFTVAVLDLETLEVTSLTV